MQRASKSTEKVEKLKYLRMTGTGQKRIQGKLKTILIQGIGLFAAINFQSIRHSRTGRNVKIII
jgi:hypothetical protein